MSEGVSLQDRGKGQKLPSAKGAARPSRTWVGSIAHRLRSAQSSFLLWHGMRIADFNFVEATVLSAASVLALILEATAMLIIALGGLETAARTIWPWLRRRATHGARRLAWLNFARWLVLGLEFTLAADILRTAIAPTWNDIGKLGAIALIRTFLNVFLERDLKEAAEARGALE